MIDIKSTSNLTRFSTPINEGSKRKYTLMKEDYITLKFSVDNPVYFKLGDYVDESFGLFELVDLCKPTINETTGGYDYELRLDAYYWKWKNKKFFYSPEVGGSEAGWNLTATLHVHMEVFLRNLTALGYTHKDGAFSVWIDPTMQLSSKLVSYDNTNLLDALTRIAETWECEWWIIGSVIHFGRCEFGEPVDFDLEANVSSMSRSDSKTSYATRVYAFGSTRNIPTTYRKNLIFDATVDDIYISDTSRKLDDAFFPIGSKVAPGILRRKDMSGYYEAYNGSLDLPEITGTDDPAGLYVFDLTNAEIKSASRKRGDDNNFIPANVNIDIVVRAFYGEPIWGHVSFVVKTLKNITITTAGNGWTYLETSEMFDVNFEYQIRSTQVCLYVYNTDGTPYLSRLDYSIKGDFVIWKERVKYNTSITFLSGANKNKKYDCFYFPETSGKKNVIQVPENVIILNGDTYAIDNIIRSKVPTGYFSKSNTELTTNGVVTDRLMLPVGTKFVNAYEGMTQEEAIEDIVIFEDVYPRREGTMKEVTHHEHKVVVEESGKENVTEKWEAYRFKDSGIIFSGDYKFPDKDLEIVFQSGALNGMRFVVIFNPFEKGIDKEAQPEKNPDGTWNAKAQVFEIKRNEDYGRYLPDSIAFPEDGNKYILSGFNPEFVLDTMIPNAEKELLEKAQEYVDKSKIDPSTYDCKMMPTYVHNDGKIKLFDIGDRVNLINKAYFDNGRQSRIIGFEYPLDIPYDSPIYTVGETAAYSRIGALEEKIDSLTYKGQTYNGSAGGGGGSSVYVIGKNDKTVPSDGNVFSSIRTLSEILSNNEELKKTFLGKYGPDETDHLLKLLGGALIQGGLTADSILVKSSLTANQLKSAISSTLSEEGDLSDLGLDLIEQGDGNEAVMSTALIEEAAASSGGANRLSDLEDVDESFNNAKNDLYGFRMKDGIYYPEVLNTQDLKKFIEVSPASSSIVIQHDRTPYAKVTLSGDSKIFNLSITGTNEGSVGQILVFQTGFKQIAVGNGIKGTIDLPLNGNTIALLTYNRLGDIIYMHSDIVLGDIQFPSPQRITDFQLVYSDSSTCTVQWSAPWANNIYDKATEYDMRYANSLVDANDAKIWAGLKRVDKLPEPETPGASQKMTITGLTANKEYYVYLKAVKVNYGSEYPSAASEFVYFKTLGNEDTSKAFRIDLSDRNLIPQRRDYLVDTDGKVCSIENMVDEADKNVFLPDGYPDITNKGYTTFWSQSKYGRDTSPFYIIIDLYSAYAIDKMFVYSRSKPYFSVYGMKDIGYGWEKVGEIRVAYNEWISLDFKSYQCRFIKIAFDLLDFGSNSTKPVMTEGVEGFPEPEYNHTLDRIDNVLLYGRAVSTRPNGIMAPIRRATVRKPVDQFFCTNGHAYQQGRIHSKCSGERMRMYIHFGQFAAKYGTADAYTILSDMRFKVNQIGWVSGNNGTGENLEDMLRNTYQRYGLKPFLCNTGVFDYCYWDRSGGFTHNRPVDGYWLPGAWKPMPKRGVGGMDKFFKVTNDPLSYKTYAKLGYALAAKYGNKQVDGTNLFYPESEPTTTGLGLVSGIEIENEPDANWNNWIGYSHSEEYSAVLSASADGHKGEIADDLGDKIPGIKGGNVSVISSGNAGLSRGYILAALLEWKHRRKDASIPVDIFSFHTYCSNIGNQESSRDAIQYGITFEESNRPGTELIKMLELRNRFASDKEIAITEFGWGEAGARDTASKYQCYSQPGMMVGDWLIPDRHRSDVKGAWIVRACMQMMKVGVDFVNYYSTECEGNYFGSGQYDSGAGIEMFRWNDCKDPTPGAMVEAIKAFEHKYARGGFAVTGLFGQILGNGAYPITRAYWWIATMRNRLKGYVYTGMKYIGTDSRIVVACFKKEGEEKGAYVVYLNDNKNTGVADVEISVPEAATTVQHVTVYVPELPNPQSVPGTVGNDHARTGLACARHERFISGQWTLFNKPYFQKKYASYAQGGIIHPANPKEGDEVVILPTAEENPYFPIVGPVWAKASSHGFSLTAKEYEADREDWQNEPQVDGNGTPVWFKKEDAAMSWRQVEAVCDYIDFHPEGIRGSKGDEVIKEVVRGAIRVNVSEFPEFFFFDGVPDTDYKSEVTDFSSRTISSSAVELWWNNTNTEDTAYQIFVSSLPETGYTLLKEVGIGIENKATLSGLSPDTTYYYKIRPLCGDKLGEMSDYTSIKTYSELPAPENLRLTSRTATSISMEWAYTGAQVADFVYYAVYRADEASSFLMIGKIEDKAVLKYADSGLTVGKTYKYKVRAVGLNGQSDYSNELTTRTLLPQECSPTLLTALTDKLGVKITLTFDLPIGSVAIDVKSQFALTEDGNVRIINAVYRDEANHANLILSIPENTLKDYEQKTDIRISYKGGGIESDYGIALDGFSNKLVVNLIGNFTDIEAIYKVNFTKEGAPLPTSKEWNNLIGNPSLATVSSELTDTYGRASKIVLSSVQNKPALAWAGISESGVCSIEGVEQAVFKYSWLGPGFGSNDSEKIMARLQLSNINNENRYTIKLYGGVSYGSDVFAKCKVNDAYSNILTIKGNKTTYMTIEDCQPSGGILNIDIINAVAGSAAGYPVTSFMIVEEYKNGNSPENTDVFLREAIITEAVNDVVKFPDVTVHLNCIGTATSYRISEVQDMTDVEWVNIVEDKMDVPYTISAGFGHKIVYVQVKNTFGPSNTRIVNVEYKDPYVALALRNILINNNDSRAYDRNVTVTVDKDGIPTYFRISEQSDLSAVEWQAWPDPKTAIVPFVLSEIAGQKTVYMQIMDSKTVCDAKADTINFIVVERKEVTLTLTLPDGADVNALVASFPVLKYNKKWIFTYTADDCPVGAYGKVWCAINRKWVDDEKFFHIGQARTTGYIPTKTLGYTDGCGAEHRMPVGVAIWPNLSNQYIDNFMSPSGGAGKSYPYMIWSETIPILDFGGALYWHNVNEAKLDKTNPIKILEGLKEDQSVTLSKSGRGMKVMMRPDGNNNYITAAVMSEDVLMMFGENTPAINLYPKNDPDFLKVTGMRKMYTENNASDLAWIQSIHDSDNPAWCHFFTHTPGQPIVDLLTSVGDRYGKGGDDSAWMATADEVYEWWFTRKNATIKKEVNGQTVKLTLSIPSEQYFYHKELSLVIDGISSLTGLTVVGDSNGMKYGMSKGKLLVNMNYDDQLPVLAEKYTANFVKSENLEDRDDAMYFVSKLTDTLASPFVERIGLVTRPAFLTSFTLSGSTTTELHIRFTYASDRATHYMISESETFKGAAWVPHSGSTGEFMLANTEGEHSIYLKVKNNFGESQVLDAVILYNPPAFALDRISINAGGLSTYERKVDVVFNVFGVDAPTHCMLSESEDFAGAVWQAYKSSVKFELSQEYAKKKVYAKIKTATKESAVVSAEIELKEKGIVKVALVAARLAWNAGKDLEILDGNGLKLNKVRATDLVDIRLVTIYGEASDITYYNNPSVIAGGSGTFTSSTNPVRPETYNGVYSYDTVCETGVYNEYTQPDVITPHRIMLKAPTGKYLIRLLGSTSNALGSTTTNKFYECNGVQAQPTFSLVNNFTDFVELDNVAPDGNGYLVIKWWGNPTRGAMCALNLIEIIKK